MSKKQCKLCNKVIKGKKNRKQHRKNCNTEHPGKKQHFVLFNLPNRVTRWDIPQ